MKKDSCSSASALGAVSDRQSLLPESDSVIRPISLRRATKHFQLREEYDFSKSRRNPYARELKRQVTIRLDTMAVDQFKKMAAELGMPYQNRINLFLKDCAVERRRPTIRWTEGASKRSDH